MLRLSEVASQSETFSKRGLRKAKTNTVNSIIDWMAQPGHCPVVFSLDRPPLLVVGQRGYHHALAVELTRHRLTIFQQIQNFPFFD